MTYPMIPSCRALGSPVNLSLPGPGSSTSCIASIISSLAVSPAWVCLFTTVDSIWNPHILFNVLYSVGLITWIISLVTPLVDYILLLINKRPELKKTEKFNIMDFVFNITSRKYCKCVMCVVLVCIYVCVIIGITSIISVFIGELALHMFSISIYIMLYPFIMDYLTSATNPSVASTISTSNGNNVLRDL